MRLPAALFLPRLRSTLQHTRSPLKVQAYGKKSEVFELISSTNTNRSAWSSPASSALQAAVRNSSRSHPSIFFRVHPMRLKNCETVDSLTRNPVALRRYFAPLRQGGSRAILKYRPPKAFWLARPPSGACSDASSGTAIFLPAPSWRSD